MAKQKTQEASNVIPFDADVKPGKTEATKRGFKEGDWIYCAFDLTQIIKIDDKGNIIEISDGNTTIKPAEGESLNSDVVELNPHNKAASDAIKGVAAEFSGYSQSIRLNVPAVFKWLVARWHELVVAKDKGEAVNKEIQRMREAIVGVINQIHSLTFEETPKEGDKPVPQFLLFK